MMAIVGLVIMVIFYMVGLAYFTSRHVSKKRTRSSILGRPYGERLYGCYEHARELITEGNLEEAHKNYQLLMQVYNEFMGSSACKSNRYYITLLKEWIDDLYDRFELQYPDFTKQFVHKREI